MSSELSNHDPNLLQEHLHSLYHAINQNLKTLAKDKERPIPFNPSSQIEGTAHSSEKNDAHWHQNRFQNSEAKDCLRNLKVQIKKLTDSFLGLQKSAKSFSSQENADYLNFIKHNKASIDRLKEKIQHLEEETMETLIQELNASSEHLDHALKQIEEGSQAVRDKQVKVDAMLQGKRENLFSNTAKEILHKPWKAQKKYLQKEIQGAFKGKSKSGSRNPKRIKDLLTLTERILKNQMEEIDDGMAKMLNQEGKEQSDTLADELKQRLQQFQECLGMFKDPVVLAHLRLIEEIYGELFGRFTHNLRKWEKGVSRQIERIGQESEQEEESTG